MSEEPAFTGAQNDYEAAGDTVIGNDVWMGSEAVVMPGINIGDGAVIDTRALVTRDVEPWAIVDGNPFKTIRKRFDERSIERLLAMQWRHWSDDQLKAVMPLMTSSNIAALFQHWKEFIRAP